MDRGSRRNAGGREEDVMAGLWLLFLQGHWIFKVSIILTYHITKIAGALQGPSAPEAMGILQGILPLRLGEGGHLARGLYKAPEIMWSGPAKA